MDAIVLFSHGSLLCGAGEALKAHARRLKERGLAPLVEIGYLNYSEPLFADAVARCVEAGAGRILVVPYFLVPGYFVKVDLPKAVSAVQQTFPQLEFAIAAPIGFDERLADALIVSAQHAHTSEHWRDDLRHAPRFCRNNLQCPLFNTSDCPHSNYQGSNSIGLPLPGVSRHDLNTPASPSLAATAHSALLIMVHGSPRPIANADMFRAAEIAQQRAVFPIVEVGFMECNEPTIPQAIDTCAAQGAERILAVPYFLHTGTHVAEDLPGLLEQGRMRHPKIDFRLGDYLGRSEQLTDILEQRIRNLREL